MPGADFRQAADHQIVGRRPFDDFSEFGRPQIGLRHHDFVNGDPPVLKLSQHMGQFVQPADDLDSLNLLPRFFRPVFQNPGHLSIRIFHDAGRADELFSRLIDAKDQHIAASGTQVECLAAQQRHKRAFALDAVEQLGASLLGNLMPPWTQWFGLKPGPDLTPQQAESLAPVLEKAARTIQAHFDRSNFIVEIHQCFLDLIVGGTASLYIEETEPGAFSAFRFTAVPLHQIVLEEGVDGYLDGAFRDIPLTLEQMKIRYPSAPIPDSILRSGEKDPQLRFRVLESLIPEKMYVKNIKSILCTL